jgi:hypothetical protein
MYYIGRLTYRCLIYVIASAAKQSRSFVFFDEIALVVSF